jgi:spore coat protein SA
MPPLGLPIPAVKGGAIEGLLTLLADENELKQKFDFTFVFRKNNKRSNVSYKYSQFLEIEENKVGMFVKKVLNKILRNKLNQWITKSYYKKVLNILNENYDSLIFENVCPLNAENFKNKYGRDKMNLHVHNDMVCYDISENFSKIYCVSEFIKSQWDKIKYQNDIQIKVMFNCIDSNKFNKKITEYEKTTIKKELNINDDDYLLIYCGRLTEEKGVDKILEALKKLNNKKIKLIILGSSFFEGSKKETPFINKLKNIADDIKEQVVFTGYIDNAEVYKYYQLANVHILPSICQEACSIAVLEAYASGNYQILTNVGGNKEVGKDDFSTYITNDSFLVKNIAEAIDTCFKNKIINRGIQVVDNGEVYYNRLLKVENHD